MKSGILLSWLVWLIVFSSSMIGCAWWLRHGSDVENIAACLLLEAAKLAPSGEPTLEQAAQIAITCGAKDADAVIRILTAERRAQAMRAAYDAGAAR